MFSPTPYGDARLTQWLRVKAATGRPEWLRRRRCLKGTHNPPPDAAYLSGRGILIGGPCTRCGSPFRREVAWIGHTWNYGDTRRFENTSDQIAYDERVFLETISLLGLRNASRVRSR